REPAQDLRLPDGEPRRPSPEDRTGARNVDRHAVVPPRVPGAEWGPEIRRGWTPQAVLHRPCVRGGTAADPRRPAAGCAAEDRPRTPVLRRADVRGAPDLGRRFEVHAVLPSPETHAPRGPPSGPTGARERVLDQGPRGVPETSLGEPFELLRLRGGPCSGPVDENPYLTWPAKPRGRFP